MEIELRSGMKLYGGGIDGRLCEWGLYPFLPLFLLVAIPLPLKHCDYGA